MADNHIACAHVAEHEGSHFTSLRTFLGHRGTILTGNFDVGALQTVRYALQRSEDRRDDDLTVVRIGNQRFERQGRRYGVAHRLVHLPISSDYRFTHDPKAVLLRSLPRSNSFLISQGRYPSQFITCQELKGGAATS